MAQYIWAHLDGSENPIEWDGVTPIPLQDGETLRENVLPPAENIPPAAPLPTEPQDGPNVIA
mgnify:CR=1 FL=1